MPEKHEFELWRNSEVGRWFFDDLLKSEVVELRMAIGGGQCHGETQDNIALNYANLVGFADGLETAIERDPYETESDRETPPGKDGL